MSNTLQSVDFGDSLSQFRDLVNRKFAGTAFANDSGSKKMLFSKKDSIESKPDRLYSLSPAAKQREAEAAQRKRTKPELVKEFGQIERGEIPVRASAKNTDEIAAILAVPAVIKRGIEIGRNVNHKGRGFSTTTFGAPVEINGVRGHMGVVVKETRPYHYHAHRILMPDGSVFAIPETENAEPTTEEAQSQKETGVVTPISSASSGIISQRNAESQPPKVRKSVKDSDYLAAVKSSYMETVQQMAGGDTKAQKNTTREGGARLPTKDSITDADIKELRKVGLKSVNKFTEADLTKSRKWAQRYFRELGTKSPFFRRWYGDWRLYDSSPINKVVIAAPLKHKAGKITNIDTSWGSDFFRETKVHKKSWDISDEIAGHVGRLVESAVLLDSSVFILSSKTKMPGPSFMHAFYVLAEYKSEIALLKLYVEEALPTKGEIFSRAYELKDIKKWQYLLTVFSPKTEA